MPQTLTAVTDLEFDAAVLGSPLPVLVDFWAAWCPPCRLVLPVLEELAEERPDLRVVKLDLDANQETAARYGVLSAPTLVLFERGAPVLTLIGARPKRRLLRELAEVLGEPVVQEGARA